MKYNRIGWHTFKIGPSIVVILLMPYVFLISIQNKKSINWIHEIKIKKIPVTLFSVIYCLFPQQNNRIENIVPIEKVNIEVLELKHIYSSKYYCLFEYNINHLANPNFACYEQT